MPQRLARRRAAQRQTPRPEDTARRRRTLGWRRRGVAVAQARSRANLDCTALPRTGLRLLALSHTDRLRARHLSCSGALAEATPKSAPAPHCPRAHGAAEQAQPPRSAGGCPASHSARSRPQAASIALLWPQQHLRRCAARVPSQSARRRDSNFQPGTAAPRLLLLPVLQCWRWIRELHAEIEAHALRRPLVMPPEASKLAREDKPSPVERAQALAIHLECLARRGSVDKRCQLMPTRTARTCSCSVSSAGTSLSSATWLIRRLRHSSGRSQQFCI
jgi:hypothetical protein